ncbi:MAG: glycoside hydrolase family 127 protein, partial [Verrucomicrobia bacterium]|nr:glycoside hydrolase family 127 protein [Verrucomicrobiota bacterium]
GRRVIDAGDPEMNMAILTALARLHRLTDEPRYLRMAREVEKDWERAGDYLRAGLDGREFFQSPRPRWESLHDLQGLVELWLITGEERYRQAFEHHWRSIRRWDRRNTGGFSSGEQATGNPYAPTAIETCCTVAWMALTVDYLRLTGDPGAADELELATFNAGLGAQHPSGRWWTYNTPMDGIREASAHTIVFQARAGTPELNCCSVNAPRVLGMLGEWAVMTATDGLMVNWLGPVSAHAQLADGMPVLLEVTGTYPLAGRVKLRVEPQQPAQFTLRVRVPCWADGAEARLNGEACGPVVAGKYLELKRHWSKGDSVELDLPIERIRAVPGAAEATGKVSLYRGPLLLAWDQRFNPHDEDAMPPLDPAFDRVSLVQPSEPAVSQPQPWLLLDVPCSEGRTMRLVDFASAGATGTRYRSWLPAARPLPPPAVTQLPADGQRLRPGPVRFQWRRERQAGASLTGYRLRIFAPERPARESAVEVVLGVTNRTVLDLTTFPALAERRDWCWCVESLGPAGESWPDTPPARFTLDDAAPTQVLPAEPRLGPNGELVVHSLRGDRAPDHGEVTRAAFASRDESGTLLERADHRLVYAVPAWPEEESTVAVRVNITALPANRLGQIFSAWNAVMDDPLRLVVDGGRVFARIEAGTSYSTPGVPVQPGEWYDLAAVRRASELSLYVNGNLAGSIPVPAFVDTRAIDCALGANPHYGGDESLAARFADFRFHARALSPDEILRLGRQDPQPGSSR